MATFEELDNDAKEFDKQETSLSLNSAIKKNPDQSAKVYSLSKEKSLPFDYVERNYDKVAAPNITDIGPNVAQLLRDREKAAVAHDDVDNLKWWETSAQEVGNIGKIVYAGANTASSAAYGFLGSAYNALSAVTAAPFRPFASDEEINKYDLFGASGKFITGLAQQQNSYADQLFPTKSVINSSVLGGIKSATMNIPALAVGIATDNPAVALNAMIGMTYGSSYITAKNAGLNEFDSVLYAGNQMLAERVTEGIPVGRLFKDLKENSGFLKTMGMQMATEVPTEELATLWQDAIDWAYLHPEKTLADFKAERPGAFADTLIATVVATGLQTGVVHSVDRLTRSKEDAQIQSIADKANESKVNSRSPEIFAQHVQDVAESYGAPDNIYIDAKEAKPLLQTMVKDSAYDIISQQIDQADAVGGDIVIPMGEFASKVATSKNFELLRNSIRLAPDSPTNSSISNQPEKIASLLEEANKNVEMKTRADQIYQEVSKQLINSGRMNADTAKVNATLIPAYVTVKAARSGLSVDDIYGMMGLKIEGVHGQISKTSSSLAQKSLAEWDALLHGLNYAENIPAKSQDDETEFLSNAPAGTRHTDESPLLKRIRKSSDQAFNELGGSPEAGRVGKTSLGQFSEYRTQADIIEPDSIHPDGRIEIQVYGKEQDQKGGKFVEEPALTFTVSKNGELSVNGPTGETFNAFKDAGWAQESTGKSGEIQDGWTSLTNKDGKPVPISQLAPLIADVHARVRAWRGEEKVGLHWSRSTGATGAILGGRQTAVFFQSLVSIESLKSSLSKLGIKSSIFENDKTIEIAKIEVPDGGRNKGIGTAAMQQIIDYADSKSKKVALSPSSDFGGSKTRLIDFYKRFGFVENKGKNKDHEISESMYRNAGKLNQNTGDNRGSFDPKTNIIKLGEASDLSTFVHELGHSFLEMEGRLFSHPSATPEMKADGQVILDWLGLESFDQLKDFETNDVSREAHEKFARGFEKYLGEGKAPSIELKEVFRRFAAWMKQVYRDLRNLNVELNDDIRTVMDRMLATDEQINRAKNVFDPLFKDAKDAGMTEAEFKAYSSESSPDSAKEVLLAKMIKQLKREYTKWWKDESIVVADQVRKEIVKQPLYSALEYMRAGGTTKEAKALAEDIDQLEEQLRKITRGNVTVKQAIARAGGINRKEAIDSGIDHEIVKVKFVSKGNLLFPAKGGMSFDGIAELLNQEGYSLDANSALEFVSSALVNDRFLNQDIEAQAENLKSEISAKSTHLDGFGANRLNREDVDVHFFGDIPGRFIGLTSKNGMPADDMAALHGLSSGSDLIDQINTEPTLSQKVKEQTHAEMVKRHGDILTDGTIEEEAAQAIRNPEHAKKLVAELSALSRKTKTSAIDREAIKAYAKETIGKMAYSKIRPAQYRAAEVRAAREAAIAKNKGDFEAAQKAKQQEIINFYLSREATSVKEKAEANRKYLQSVQVRKFNPKDVHEGYSIKMQTIANLYDFRTSSPDNQDRARSRLQAISAWIDAQAKNEEDGFYPIIIDPILSNINNTLIQDMTIPSYKEMTADAIQGVADQVRNLRYIGGQLSENSKEKLRQESKRVGDSIRANGKGIIVPPEEIKDRDVKMSALREFAQDHIRLANQIEELDGYKEFGPLFEAFYQDIIDSSNKELKLKRGAFEDIKTALDGLTASEMAKGKDEKTFSYIQADSDPQVKKTLTLSRRARIMFGLYWGSPEGRDAIRQGHGMSDADAQQVLNSLEEKDLNAIEGIWKTNEVHWPEVSRINQKLKGVALPKVEHVPYAVNGRTLPGGYVRLYYQYNQKDSIREIKAEDLLMTRTGNRLAKQTKNGSRNERVGSGGRKVSWEFNNVFVALDETIHDIAFAETASKASRFIRSPDVSSAIIDCYGKEKYDSMVGALSGIISGNTAITHPISGFLQHFRVAQTYGMLGYSVRNFVQQPLAYANVFGKATTSFEGFGEAKVLSEAIKFAMSPQETMKFVDSLSEFMINRTAIINRDTSEIKQRLSHGSMAGGAWESFKDHAFDIQTIGDSLVAYPSWMAAYNEGLRKFANQKKAITFADEFISATVGSGMVKDMSPMLQGGGRVGQAIGSEQLKSITFMGSFFNVNMNLMRDSFKKANYLEIGGVKTIPRNSDFYRQMAWYLVIPAILGAWITGGEPKDDDGFFTWAAKEVGAYGLSAIFFVRDLVSLARGFGPSSSYTRALDAAAKLAKEAAKIYNGDKEIDEKTAAKVLRSAGMIFPIPGSGQAARTFEYLGSDDEFNPYKALVTGVDR